jgi:DNA-binding NtrC family response regulator
MLKRLLFVDDDAMVLAGLRRALHDMRQEWDMHFAPGAYAALQALEKERFDAVITDMRMPSMDGALLLDCIKDRYPQVVRIILSGQSEKEAVLRSIAPAHQYLAKPCDIREAQAASQPGLCLARSGHEPGHRRRHCPTALDPQLAGHLQRTDGGPALGNRIARAN